MHQKRLTTPNFKIAADKRLAVLETFRFAKLRNQLAYILNICRERQTGTCVPKDNEFIIQRLRELHSK